MRRLGWTGARGKTQAGCARRICPESEGSRGEQRTQRERDQEARRSGQRRSLERSEGKNSRPRSGPDFVRDGGKATRRYAQSERDNVVASFVSFASPQAAKLTHCAAPPFPTKPEGRLCGGPKKTREQRPRGAPSLAWRQSCADDCLCSREGFPGHGNATAGRIGPQNF